MTAPLSVAPRELCVSNEVRALRRFACRFGEASTLVLDVVEHREGLERGSTTGLFIYVCSDSLGRCR